MSGTVSRERSKVGEADEGVGCGQGLMFPRESANAIASCYVGKRSLDIRNEDLSCCWNSCH